MNFNKIFRAFSLTELLIVLVVVAVLFAALAPILTKRRNGSTVANEPVWMFVNEDDNKDAFYDPGATKLSSTAFIGVNPKDLSGNLAPYSKVVIKAKPNQNMIQFRYGTSSGIGAMAGVFTFDNNGNIITAGKLKGTAENNYNEVIQSGRNNTVAGMGAFAKPATAYNVVSVGAKSTTGVTSAQGQTVASYVAVGKNSALYGKAANSVLLGADSGKAETYTIQRSVAVGSNTLGTPGSDASVASGGQDNVLLGASVGGVGFGGTDAVGQRSRNNVIVGSTYYSTSAKNNTILGYGVYNVNNSTVENITAAGYGACDSVSGNTGRKTCLGYHSAINTGMNNATANLGWDSDNYDHIYIGGQPYLGLGGRSVLEVHNIPKKSTLSARPQIGPTVVLNSHLVVRGNVFFPTAEDGVLRAHSALYPIDQNKNESGKDRCGRRCIFGSKTWRDSAACSFFSIIIGALAGLVIGVAGFFSFGSAWVLAPVLIGAAGAGIGALFDGDGYRRARDADSASVLYSGYDTTNDFPACANANENYPSGANSSNGACPNLKLSDIRLKDNITENTDSIEKLLFVMPYNYTFKTDEEAKPQVGVMAQDLQKYFPQSVSEVNNGYLGIRWDEMFYTTINSVKSLNKKVQNIEAEIYKVEDDTKLVAKDQKSTKARIKNITKRINELEK